MNLNCSGEERNCHSEQVQVFSMADQSLQEQHYIVPSTSAGYTGQDYPVTSQSYNHRDPSNCRYAYNNGFVNNFAELPIINPNTLQNLDHIEDAVTNPAATENNSCYRRIILPNGETILLEGLYQYSVNNNSLPNSVNKRKRIRTVFLEAQTKRLEAEYAINKYLDQNRRKKLAESLNLTERTVKVWFQNHRMKEKKVMSDGVSSIRTNNAFTVALKHHNMHQTVYASNIYDPNQIASNLEVPQNSAMQSHRFHSSQLPTYSDVVQNYPPNSSSSHNQVNLNMNPDMKGYCDVFNGDICDNVEDNLLTVPIDIMENNIISLDKSSPSSNSDEGVGSMNSQIMDRNEIKFTGVIESSFAKYTDLDGSIGVSYSFQ